MNLWVIRRQFASSASSGKFSPSRLISIVNNRILVPVMFFLFLARNRPITREGAMDDCWAPFLKDESGVFYALRKRAGDLVDSGLWGLMSNSAKVQDSVGIIELFSSGKV